MHPLLAFLCFFRVLFGKRLPESFPQQLLPPLPERMDEEKIIKELPKPAVDQASVKKTLPIQSAPVMSPIPAGRPVSDGALQLLGLLQREGRLIDFLRESIESYDDATIGAAVRDIHKGCKKAIDEHFDLAPVMGGAENDKVAVEKGFDPARIRLVGEVKGEPPFKGTLRHHGWTVRKVKLPSATASIDFTVVAPAEVEL